MTGTSAFSRALQAHKDRLELTDEALAELLRTDCAWAGLERTHAVSVARWRLGTRAPHPAVAAVILDALEAIQDEGAAAEDGHPSGA